MNIGGMRKLVLLLGVESRIAFYPIVVLLCYNTSHTVYIFQ